MVRFVSVEKTLSSLLRAGICGEPVNEEIAERIDAELLKQLYTVSNAHDLAHILGAALAKCGKLGDDECSRNFRGKALLAMSRYERINYDLHTICDALEQAGIPFIPLKGSVLRDYYPEPWMRTSCDIDVLVHKENLDAATQVLRENLEYTPHMEGLHDVSFYSQSGVHIELHFDLIEKGWAGSACEILKNVWDYATPKEGCQFHYALSDEMFYFYHIAHMAKHFEQGGCGIRSFFDLWILDNIESADIAKRDALLAKGNLLKFTQTARRLTKVWFEGASHDSVTQRMEEYVIRGGVYGSKTNEIAALQKRKGGKWQYAFSRIVLPYDEIKYMYPFLQEHPWLTPFMQVFRWFRILFNNATNAFKELSYNQSISQKRMQEFRQFFEELGL